MPSDTGEPHRRGSRCDAAAKYEEVHLTLSIDAIRRALESPKNARSHEKTVIDYVRNPILVLTRELRVERANLTFCETFGSPRDRTDGRVVFEIAELSEPGWISEKLRKDLKALANRKATFADAELTSKFCGTELRTMSLHAQTFQVGSKRLILLVFEDVTERRLAERAIAFHLEEANRQLQDAKEELRALAARAINTREDEQRRIARELHDDLMQRVGLLQSRIGRFLMKSPEVAGAETATMLRHMDEELKILSETTRNISYRLHPVMIDDLGLVAALRRLAEEVTDAGAVSVRLISKVEPASLPRGSFAAGVYRIAQEALHNASKYATNTPVTMSLSVHDNELQIRIKDAGPGFDFQSRRRGGLGIPNMKERARMLGGDLRIQSPPPGGTTVTARIPLPAETRDKGPERGLTGR